jgi:hypothetical protein
MMVSQANHRCLSDRRFSAGSLLNCHAIAVYVLLSLLLLSVEREPTVIASTPLLRSIALLQPLHPGRQISPSMFLNESVVLGAIRVRSETPPTEHACVVPKEVDLGGFNRQARTGHESPLFCLCNRDKL